MTRGETDEARQALAAAGRLLDEQGAMSDGSDLGNLGHDWLCCRILRREAETLLNQPAAKTEP